MNTQVETKIVIVAKAMPELVSKLKGIEVKESKIATLRAEVVSQWETIGNELRRLCDRDSISDKKIARQILTLSYVEAKLNRQPQNEQEEAEMAAFLKSRQGDISRAFVIAFPKGEDAEKALIEAAKYNASAKASKGDVRPISAADMVEIARGNLTVDVAKLAPSARPEAKSKAQVPDGATGQTPSPVVPKITPAEGFESQVIAYKKALTLRDTLAIVFKVYGVEVDKAAIMADNASIEVATIPLPETVTQAS